MRVILCLIIVIMIILYPYFDKDYKTIDKDPDYSIYEEEMK